MNNKKNISMEEIVGEILVPMKVHAMLVGRSPVPTVFTNIADDFTRFKLNPLGDFVPSELMSDKSTEKPGIHIHWFMPKSLRQGLQNKSDEMPIYPRVPNRYLISRFMKTNASSEVKIKYWMVESDVLQMSCKPENFNDDSCSFPYLQDPNQAYRFLGRSYEYDLNPPKILDVVASLTTINSGNPAFSVMYPYCRNVFGFYDDLLEANGTCAEESEISYCIRGYYEGQSLCINDADECLGLYNWQPSAGVVFPAKPVLHGLVTNIVWQTRSVDYNGPFINHLNSPQLAVGNTSAEALSALKSRSLKNENLLKVLMNDKAHEVTKLNGVFRSNYSEHAQRFVTKTEEKEYILQNLMDCKDYKELPDIPPMDKIYYENLKILDAARRQSLYAYKATQAKVNDLWNKYVLKSLVQFPPAEKAAAAKWMLEYEQELKALFTNLQELSQKISDAEKQMAFFENQINENLKGKYETAQIAGSRYFEPNAPVLLLDGVERGHVFTPKNEESKDAPLICRSANETLSYLPINFELRGQEYSVSVYRNELIAHDACRGNCIEILMESALFNGLFAHKIYDIVINKSQIKNLTDVEKETLLKEINRAQQSPFEEMGKIYPDSVALNFWTGMVWQPIMLCWRGSYYPDKALLTDSPSLKNWTFQTEDYVFTGEPVTSEQAIVLEGRLLLTPQVTDLLFERAKKYLPDIDPSRLKGLNELDVLSQVLDSFNDRFLMNQLALRFPAVIYKNGSQDLAYAVRRALEEYAIEKPIFNSFFSPLRGGFYKFDQVRLVDTFGEFLNVECKSLAISEDLNPQKGQRGSYVMLPPRFMQASKLSFDFLDFKTNSPCDFSLSDTPICAWLIPNHIDQSLMLYDESGEMLGSLVVTGFKDTPVMLRPAAGHSQVPTMQRELKAFVEAILNRSALGENVLTPLLKLIDSSFWDTQGSGGAQSTGLSLYIGRPLVLARARMQVDQEGPPAHFKILENNNKKPVPLPPTSIKCFKMPLLVGEKNNFEDGVIGFFENNGEKTYTQFNSQYAPSESSDYFKSNNKVDVPMTESGDSQLLTLLMDPLQSVNLISGMLPVQTHNIPQNRIENALNALYLTLYTGPILVGEEPLVLPFANLPDRKWSFMVPLIEDNWLEISELYPSNGNAFLAKEPIGIVEGYMKLKAGETNES